MIIDDEIKDTIKQLLSMFSSWPRGESHHLLGQNLINGALIYGPPGTGKTHLCRAISKESNKAMLVIDTAMVISKYAGDSEKYIKAAFTLSAKLHPCILFIDEVDSLFFRRSSDDKSWQRTSLTQFLQEMDGLSANKDAPFVIGATNRPSDLDEAFLRRLPHKVFITLPTLEERKKILRIFLTNEDLSPLVSIDALAQETHGYSGSDLRSLCSQAALVWATEQSSKRLGSSQSVALAPLLLTVNHFEKALNRIMPSVSSKSMEDIERFSERFKQHITPPHL